MKVDESRRLQVLLVEDHSETAASFAKFLQMDGFVVHVVPGFDAAVKLASKHRFDILLANVQLPDGSGPALMRKLLSEHEAIKGIAVSGYGADQDVQLCTDAGFSAHLLKPVTFEKVKEVMGRICDDLKLLREEDGSVGPTLEYIKAPESHE